MVESESKSSFDRLVAGLDAQDRITMLNRINQGSVQTVALVSEEIDTSEKFDNLSSKLQSESLLYRLYLWIRSLFTKNSTETIYNEDLIANLARKLNHNHPGIVNHKAKALDYIFYERLLSIRDAADFFRPYFGFINDNPGDFYVFLSTFVAPDLSEKINSEADPFVNPFSKVGGPEIRQELLRKLDIILKDMDSGIKNRIYLAITAVNWLDHFISIPYIHFISQFTNVADNSYSGPYNHCKDDLNILCSVFDKIMPIENEILEAIYLFSQRKNLNENVQEKDIEKVVREFMSKASSHLATVQDFAGNVSIKRLGRIVNNKYDWEPENMEGAEGWFATFRNQWHVIFDIRWNEWLREQKKANLSENLKLDFNLQEFPAMKYRPWLKLWTNVTFGCELTGGFLSWFVTEKYDEIALPLNEVVMEGIFIKSENRSEYSDALNDFINANTNMSYILEKLSPKGEYGKIFEDYINNQVHTFQAQNQINSMIQETEERIKECIKQFCRGARTIERVFHGFFDESKDGVHESLQNMSTIKGRDNHQFRQTLMDIRDLLRKCLFYISELEPIDSVTE